MFGKYAAAFAALSSLAVAAAGPAQAQGDTVSPANVDAEPTISVPEFSYPPSSLSSDELKAAYARSLATPGDGTIAMPDDPRIVQMMRLHVEAQFAETVPAVREMYPVETENDTIGGVEVIRVRPVGGVSEENSRRILLNLHGGAFMVGWPSVALLDAIPVAHLSGIEVITIHYSLYPESVHPAALEDLTAVYTEILEHYEPDSVGIFGGSAGGVLTLQSIGWFTQNDLPLPGAIAPLAAGFQTAVGDSSIWNFSGGFARPGTTLVSTGGYFGDQSRTQWVPNTAPEQLASFPPTLWMAGTRAPELSGSVTGHASLLKQGVASQLYVIEGGWHSSYSTAPDTPESQDAMRYIAQWFDQNLAR